MLEINNNDKTIEEQQKINQSILEAIKNLEEKTEKTNIVVPTVQKTTTTTNKRK